MEMDEGSTFQSWMEMICRGLLATQGWGTDIWTEGEREREGFPKSGGGGKYSEGLV